MFNLILFCVGAVFTTISITCVVFFYQYNEPLAIPNQVAVYGDFNAMAIFIFILPMLILWLIVALLISLNNNKINNNNIFNINRNIKYLIDQSQLQHQTIRVINDHNNKLLLINTIFKYLSDINSSVAMLVEYTGLANSTELEKLWGLYDKGDYWCIVNILLLPHINNKIFAKLMANKLMNIDGVGMQIIQIVLIKCEKITKLINSIDCDDDYIKFIFADNISYLENLCTQVINIIDNNNNSIEENNNNIDDSQKE